MLGRRRHPRRAGAPRPFDSAQGTRGTDPHDPGSVLRLSQLDKTSTGMRMQFPTLTGNPSTALRAPGPIAANTPTTSPPTSGTPSPPPSPATWHPERSRRGKPVIVEDPAATNRAQRFYRLIVLP